LGARPARCEAQTRLARGGRAIDFGNEHKASHGDDIARLRSLHLYLGDKHLDEIDQTLIDRIKFDREKLATAGTLTATSP